MASQKEERQWFRSSRSHITMLVITLALIALFVVFQEMAVDSRDFLLLMFASFAFPAIGAFLTVRVFIKSSRAEKKLCFVVAVVFIVALAYVTNSSIHVPRGGFYHRTEVTPSSFTLTAERGWDGSYSGGYSQIMYAAKYPEASISIFEGWPSFDVFTIRSQTTIRMNATLYVFVMLKPYEATGRAIFSEPLAFNESRTTEFLQPRILVEWGRADPAYRTRFNGYDLELMIRLQGTGPQVEPSLNFTVDMSNFRLLIDDYIVDSELQNGLSIALAGVFIGIMLYIPAKFLHEFISKKN